METDGQALKTPDAPARAWGRPVALAPYLGALLAAAGCLTIAIYLFHAMLGTLLLAAWGALGLLVWANGRPQVLLALLVLVAPFNYGRRLGPASIKLSELIAFAMLGLILLRLAAGDGGVWGRLRRALPVAAALGLLALMTAATASPHPHVFNIRYEIESYVVCLYALLFFQRAHWRLLLAAFVAAAALETIAALGLYFGLGLTGTSFFDVDSDIRLIRYTTADLESFAGGKFRISGTLGHKNMLAAFYVLVLPLITIEMLRRFRPAWLLVVLPSLVVLAMSDSMTGWGAVIVMVVLALIHLRRFDYLAAMVLLVLPLAGLALLQFGDTIFYRVEQLFGGQEGWGTVSSRGQIFHVSMRLLDEHTWLGIGRNNFAEYGDTYYGHAHNLFLMKMIEMGLPAGLIFAFVVVALMAFTWRPILFDVRRLSAQRQYYHVLALWLGCLGFMAMNFLDYNYAHFGLGPLFMANLGILVAVAYDFEGRETIPRTTGLEHAQEPIHREPGDH